MDDSLAQIDQAITDNNWTSVTLVGSPDNGGFSSGNNIGISISRGDLILLLNSDTIVSAGAFELLVQTMLDNPRGWDGQVRDWNGLMAVPKRVVSAFIIRPMN